MSESGVQLAATAPMQQQNDRASCVQCVIVPRSALAQPQHSVTDRESSLAGTDDSPLLPLSGRMVSHVEPNQHLRPLDHSATTAATVQPLFPTAAATATA